MKESTCNLCGSSILFTPQYLGFLDKVAPVFNNRREQIPPPQRCYMCRHQRRLAFRNERVLYKRNCGLTGESIISSIAPDKPQVVYGVDAYWSDLWDPRSYGREYDFTRSFFAQFAELKAKVPYLALCVSPDARENNCPYVNFAGKNKNCHMIFDSDFCEDCSYSNVIKHSRHSMDCSYVDNCELCYECIDCKDCYGLRYSQDCYNCSTSYFLKNCVGCSDCFFCSNLTRKRYCIENKQYSPEDYQAELKRRSLGSRSTIEQLRKQFAAYVAGFPQKALHGLKNENCSGDYISASKNCSHCFNVVDGEDLMFCDAVYHGVKDCVDVSSFGENIELVYESGTVGVNSFHILFCHTVVGCRELIYCENCREASHCFGSLGLNRNQYCILNKQYSKDEYEQLVPQIIEQMRAHREWGEFFPPQLSHFDYNETIAFDYYPLEEEIAKAIGFTWRKRDEKQYQLSSYHIPDTIADVAEEVCDKLLACSCCQKNYKIGKVELSFYKKQELALPSVCADCRHTARMAKRNPMAIWQRQCDHCDTPIWTSYAQNRPEKVYCEECYQEAIA